MDEIESGVDKLVKFINEEKQVTIRQAAKKIGVAHSVIADWADFLEEEGLISKKITFMHEYLVPRRSTAKAAVIVGIVALFAILILDVSTSDTVGLATATNYECVFEGELGNEYTYRVKAIALEDAEEICASSKLVNVKRV